MKVLIIDDDPNIRSIARLSLGHLGGMDVVEAASGPEGVSKAQVEKPDLILLDVMMSEMDGAVTLVELRSEEATYTTPVIFMTARTDEAEIERLILLGAAGVVIKPFDPRGLAATVKSLFQQASHPRS
jgi:DNA-binding response OmpR family regulator